MPATVLPRFELAAEKIALTGTEPYLVRAESASAAEAMLVDGSVDAIFGWAPALAEASADISGGTIDRLVAAGIDRASLTRRLEIATAADMARTRCVRVSTPRYGRSSSPS